MVRRLAVRQSCHDADTTPMSQLTHISGQSIRPNWLSLGLFLRIEMSFLLSHKSSAWPKATVEEIIDSIGRLLPRRRKGALFFCDAKCRLLAHLGRPTHAAQRQLLGEQRSRQPVTGATVHDPQQTSGKTSVRVCSPRRSLQGRRAHRRFHQPHLFQNPGVPGP